GVNINGKEAKKELKALRMQVGIVFQYPEYQLFEETVERDIAFGPRNLNLSDIEIQHRVTEAMDMLKLSKKMRKKSPFELSGGQKRKIAIAGVLAMKPKYLILDEPTAGLDPKGREEFLELIADLHQQGLTVVMVSHSMDDIARYAQRMIVLEHGEIRLEGTPQAVFAQSDLLDQIGLGVPTLTRLLIELQKQGWDVRTDLFHPTDVSQEILRALSKREQRKGADLC
ncbi:MAG: energy-coupling factor transporter ATPase, partial [Peptococcaceae bacterium]|nr:energy-coupling factor transporter ATPase [Peptococcaceae bacterium]